MPGSFLIAWLELISFDLCFSTGASRGCRFDRALSWSDRALITSTATLGADEAKMYNCLILRGRVGPNARLTASMQWMHAKIDTRLECLVYSPAHIFSISQTSASSDQTRKRKKKKGFALHLLSVCRKSMLWETKIMKEKARNNAGSVQGAGWH